MTKRGDMFKQIFTLFEEGKTPEEVIAEGYAHSTVYWAKKQIEQGRTAKIEARGSPGWVQAGLRQGWIHRCVDNKLGIIEDRIAHTRQGTINFRLCLQCKEILNAEFSKWPGGELSDRELRALGQGDVEFAGLGELLEVASHR